MNPEPPNSPDNDTFLPLQTAVLDDTALPNNPNQRKKIRLLGFVLGTLLVALFIHLAHLAVVMEQPPSDTIRPVLLDGDFMDFIFNARGQVEIDIKANSLQANLAVYHGTERVDHLTLFHSFVGDDDTSTHWRGDLLWAATDIIDYPHGSIQVMFQSDGFRITGGRHTGISPQILPDFNLSSLLIHGETPLRLGEPMPLQVWTLGHIFDYHIAEDGTRSPMRHASTRTFANPIEMFEPANLAHNEQTVILYLLFT